jgi:transposase
VKSGPSSGKDEKYERGKDRAGMGRRMDVDIMTKAALETSIATLDTWIQVFAVLVAIGIVGEVGFGVRHWVLNRRLVAIQHAEDLNQEQAIARFNKEAGDARRDAGAAIERAANANERAATAEQRAAEAVKRAEEERTERLKLQASLQPRRLTGAQKETLAKLLTGSAGAIAIVSTMLDGEGSDFANDFESAFKAANWQTMRISNHISEKRGVRVGTVAGTTLPITKQLEHALSVIGVSFENASFSVDDRSTSPWFQSGVLYLVIERKPDIKVDESK